MILDDELAALLQQVFTTGYALALSQATGDCKRVAEQFRDTHTALVCSVLAEQFLARQQAGASFQATIEAARDNVVPFPGRMH